MISVSRLDIAYGVILAVVGGVIVQQAGGWSAVGGYAAGLVVALITLLTAEGGLE